MSASDRELDKVSQHLLDALGEMRALERRKRATQRSSDEFHELAEAIAAKASEVRRLALVELEGAREDSPLPADRSVNEPGDWTRSSRG